MHLPPIDLHKFTGWWEQAVFNGGGDRLVSCPDRDREDYDDRDEKQINPITFNNCRFFGVLGFDGEVITFDILLSIAMQV
jgi:hypothetical protein